MREALSLFIVIYHQGSSCSVPSHHCDDLTSVLVRLADKDLIPRLYIHAAVLKVEDEL